MMLAHINWDAEFNGFRSIIIAYEKYIFVKDAFLSDFKSFRSSKERFVTNLPVSAER